MFDVLSNFIHELFMEPETVRLILVVYCRRQLLDSYILRKEKNKMDIFN